LEDGSISTLEPANRVDRFLKADLRFGANRGNKKLNEWVIAVLHAAAWTEKS
jgi:hypothetical protein